MERQDCYEAGRIIKSFGYKGGLLVELKSGFAELIERTGSVFIETDEELVPFFIASMEEEGERNFRIFFDDINDSDGSRAFSSPLLWFPADKVPEGFLEEQPLVGITGYRVIDQHFGELGVAGEILDIPGNTVLTVVRGNREILLPLAGDILRKVDRKKSCLYIEAPDGLIASYLA